MSVRVASPTTWDFDRYGAIFERQAQLVRTAGALAELPQHLTGLAWHKVFTGDLGVARLLVADIDNITAATPARPIGLGRPLTTWLPACTPIRSACPLITASSAHAAMCA